MVHKDGEADAPVEEMEDCSGHLDDWPKYWPMCVSRSEAGTMHNGVQGENFSESEVGLLLDGQWHLVD